MSSDPELAPPRRSALADWWTLAKPGITALICLVAVGGFVLARPDSVDPVRLGLVVGLGALASAGSAMLNHYLERDRDRAMRRTRGRPLATDRVDSRTTAVVGLTLAALGVGGAALTLNLLTGVSILLGAVTYVLVYTAWLKPRTSWNIVIGGFAGSAPALAGGAAAIGSWSPGVLAFALLVFFWTPPHFWSLALMLKDDYARVGLPMLPRMNDVAFSGKVVFVSAVLLLPPSVLVAVLGPVAWPVGVALVALAVGFVIVTWPLWREVTARRARRGFIYSGPYLLGVVLALAVNVPLVHFGLAPRI